MAPSPQSGFSLIEILISIVVMSIGLLGLGGLQLVSLKGVSNAHSNNVASMLSMDLADRMRSNAKGVEGGFYGLSINCNVRTTQCRGSQTCTPKETAQFDLYELACGTWISGKRQGGARNLLPKGLLSVNCPNGCDQPNAVHDITLSWLEGNMHEGQKGDTHTTTLTVGVIP